MAAQKTLFRRTSGLPLLPSSRGFPTLELYYYLGTFLDLALPDFRHS